ncbi:PEPxxWA-CTERM sorting domain-containing protein [Phenylobacterium sp.]|uniref:PEPxxWA-CTERM sorting domain-containing protein n=1 Tax=Phenylobacterium sp. TaxID=1871053 RepID=UPI0025E5AA33|nr:PEPxxWA-CTERM sorting domain-containing protein [Phenylobacterium sp.]MBX3485457.1 PEPxxWA-CTERM sorting domain-containing protein [Phenylobacterium sp.]MCW5759753.1 PEPxxWA-CTERM sorting domain-containing protein [Phenylobacterium sp.]
MRTWILGAAAALALAAPAQAGVIISPTAITASTTFPGYDVDNLINQSGLTAGFVSGVTDFDAYMAGDPRHAWDLENEWFTTFNQPGAVLEMDLGAIFNVLTLALWTDEYWGAGAVTIATSTDGVSFADVGSGVPTDWATGPQDYPADVFALTPSAARYVRLTLSDCPPPLSAPDGGCGLGEIAFEVTTVPEPATWGLMIMGFAALGLAARRRRAPALA